MEERNEKLNGILQLLKTTFHESDNTLRKNAEEKLLQLRKIN